jgi:uncharacterized protein (DUF2141 family)
MSIFLLALVSFFAPHTPPRKVMLTVEAQSIRTQKGTVQMGLYASPNGFPDKAKPVQGKAVTVSGATAQIVFEVEPGDYALAVYHDENGNGKLDTGMFGIPKEPYGFSNNIRPRFSAPSFAECRVTVGETDKTIAIALK